MFVNEFISKLREKVKSGPYFQDLIKKYFITNSHKVELTMHPGIFNFLFFKWLTKFRKDPEYTTKLSKEEEKLIAEISQRLTEKEIQEIETKSKELELHQSKPQDVSCLPSLKIEDIPREAEKIKLEKKKIQNIPVTLSAQPTNGIVYFRSLINIPDLPEDLIPFVPLFTNVKIFLK